MATALSLRAASITRPMLPLSLNYSMSGSNLRHSSLSAHEGEAYKTDQTKMSWKLMAAAALAGGGLATWYALDRSVSASDLELEAPHLPWWHRKDFIARRFHSLDCNSVRRGYQVYKQVCAACHSLKYVQYHHFIDAFMTEEEAKAEAAEIQVEDGPDESGKMFMRPGRLTDFLPRPYPNVAAAKAANNGAEPPDMSLIALAKKDLGGIDYIFHLLTGYEETPAGVEVGEGQAYNPYFAGGVLSMPQQLFDDMLEYEDGTPATQSQMAKDVCNFLEWAAQPYYDWYKWGYSCYAFSVPIIVLALFYLYRHSDVVYKTQKVFWQRFPYKGRLPRGLRDRNVSSIHDVNNTPKIP